MEFSTVIKSYVAKEYVMAWYTHYIISGKKSIKELGLNLVNLYSQFRVS